MDYLDRQKKVQEWEQRVAHVATCLKNNKTNEKERLAAINMMRAKASEEQKNLKRHFRNHM